MAFDVQDQTDNPFSSLHTREESDSLPWEPRHCLFMLTVILNNCQTFSKRTIRFIIWRSFKNIKYQKHWILLHVRMHRQSKQVWNSQRNHLQKCVWRRSYRHNECIRSRINAIVQKVFVRWTINNNKIIFIFNQVQVSRQTHFCKWYGLCNNK